MLPPLDLGVDIESDVPKTYIADEAIRRGSRAADVSPVDSEAQKKRSQLLQEIETIRRSIDVLKSDTPAPSSSTDSRRQSMASGRTLSQNLSSFIPSPSHLRPPRQTDPHIRTHSMDLTRVGDATSISRPSSIPLDDDWDSYVRDHKLFQPPSGVSAPIQTLSLSLSASSKPGVSPAITEALAQRHRRESSLSFGGLTPAIAPAGALTPESSSTGNASPLPRSQPKKTDGQGGHRTPVAILPPRKPVGTPTPQKAETPRTKTYEELAERHREKMREMQAPLTKAEKAQAILQAAKARWEMSKEKEKASATKRLAEKAAAVTKDAKKKGKGVDNEEEPVRGRTAGREEGAGRHSRSLSAELLASLPRANSSSKRMSMMKVEDWQRHQVDEPKPKSVSPTTHQGSVSKRPSIVPFPDSGAHRDTMTRERRLPATARRDPPA